MLGGAVIQAASFFEQLQDSLLKGQPLQGKVTLKMKQDLEELLAEGRFSPFVVTTHDGFAIAVGEEARRHILLGARMVVIMDQYGNFPISPTTPFRISTKSNRASE